MIYGAAEVFRRIPGKSLDPWLVLGSQPGDATGFVLISHAPDSPIGRGPNSSQFHDILFFDGPKLIDCTRLNRDLRFAIPPDNAAVAYRNDPDAEISLFLAPGDSLSRFRSTFYLEPCLKVQINPLSHEQVLSLLESSCCQHGIIEWNEFSFRIPSLQLTEVNSRDELKNFRPALWQGRLFLYDIERNRELDRYALVHHPPPPCPALSEESSTEFLPGAVEVRHALPAVCDDSAQVQDRASLPGSTPTAPRGDESKLISLFDDFLRSFGDSMASVLGEKSCKILARAEMDFRPLHPEFDRARLNGSTAILTLDLVEATLRRASAFKRSRLRRLALLLVSDLYHQGYEVLETEGKLEIVERAYFRLRGE